MGGARDGQLAWRPLDHGRVLAILHNPEYAGTYVYGRTKTRNVALPGEEPRVKGRTRQVDPEDWPFVLHDHHPGYITWEQFQRNQQRLIENCTSQHQERRGALREGAALLQGLVLCGRCGRRMTIRYMDDGKIALVRMQSASQEPWREDLPVAPRRRDRCGGGRSLPGGHAAGPAGGVDGGHRPDRGPGPPARPPVGDDPGARAVRGRIGPPPVPGGRPREPPGRADPGAGLGREARRGGTPGAGGGHTAQPLDPPGGSRGAGPDPGPGAGPARDLAAPRPRLTWNGNNCSDT